MTTIQPSTINSRQFLKVMAAGLLAAKLPAVASAASAGRPSAFPWRVIGSWHIPDSPIHWWTRNGNISTWEGMQRTEAEHCGEPYKIYLDIEQPGLHTIEFSVREGGFEFDKWLMTKDRNFARPADPGPVERYLARSE